MTTSIAVALRRLEDRLSPTGEVTDPQLRAKILAACEHMVDAEPDQPLALHVEVARPAVPPAHAKQLKRLETLVVERCGASLPSGFLEFHHHVYALRVIVEPEGAEELGWEVRTATLSEIHQMMEQLNHWKIVPITYDDFGEPISLVYRAEGKALADPFVGHAFKDHFGPDGGFAKHPTQVRTFEQWFPEWIERGFELVF
jgi:hypothetical protein